MLERLRSIGARILGSLSMRGVDADFEEELESHLALLTEENIRRGLTPEEAARAARLRLGNRTQLRESHRELRGLPVIETFLQDLRYASRTLARNAAYTTVAVITLALGIGANAAIFSAVYVVLLKPLPFPDSERLVAIWKKNPPRGWVRNPISPAEFLAWRDHRQAFEDMAAFTQTSCVLNGGGEAEEDPCEVVSSNLFPLLGASPIRGRQFSPDEDLPGGPRAAILSHGLWQRRFGADDRAIGRAIQVNGASHTVVGVMPASFSHSYETPYGAVPELWVAGIALLPTRTWNDYLGVGRLKPGVGLRQAEAEMDPVSVGLGQAYPELRGWRAQLMTLRTMASGDTRSTLLVLMGAVVFVLLIACANVANLLLARGATRASELAVRHALGASHGRLIRQLLTESLLVSLAGGVLGVLLATWASTGLVALAPSYLLRSAPGLAKAVVDWRVLTFTLAVSLATTIVAGLAPAIHSTTRQTSETLKEAGRGCGPSARGRRLRGVLVVTEIALATVLLAGAGLMVRTLARLGRVNPGFNPASVLTLRVRLSGPRYAGPEARTEFWRRVVASVETLPGVESASVSRGLPIGDWAGQFFTTADRPDPPPGQVPDANYIVVGPDYFRVMQIPLRGGRAFDEHDTTSVERVAIVNEQLARECWPGQDPLGKRLRMGSPASQTPWLSVVGVVGNVQSRGPEAGFHAEVYVPYRQFPWVLSPEHLVVRTTATVNPASLAGAVVREVHRVDKDRPAADVRTMEEVALEPTGERRMVMALLGAFAGIALVLSAMGVYSVLSYSVARRTREIGVRVALGARRGDVLRLVVFDGARLAALGIAAGLGAALSLTQVMAGLLYGVRATDPATLGAVAMLLAAASLVAGYVPARRATAVDPVVALRYE